MLTSPTCGRRVATTRARRCNGTVRPTVDSLRAAKPWLAVNPNYKEINAASEVDDTSSVYNYFSRMVKLRQKTPALVYGDYADLDPKNPNLFAYTRTLGAEKYLVVLNFSKSEVSYSLPKGMKAGEEVMANLDNLQAKHSSVLKLKGWEARVYKQ